MFRRSLPAQKSRFFRQRTKPKLLSARPVRRSEIPDRLSRDDRADCASLEFPTMKRGVSGAREAGLLVDRPFQVRIDQGDVSGRAVAQGPPERVLLGVEPEQVRGIA